MYRYYLADAVTRKAPSPDIFNLGGLSTFAKGLYGPDFDPVKDDGDLRERPDSVTEFLHRKKMSIGVASRKFVGRQRDRETGLCGCTKGKCQSHTCPCYCNGLLCSSKCHGAF